MAVMAGGEPRWRPARRRWLGLAAGIVVSAATLFGRATVAAGQVKPAEYQLKAVFLFNFAKFVTWPDSAFAAADTPLVIGILGDDPFGDDLAAVVRGERVDGHPLVVRRLADGDSVPPCHILFVSRSEHGRLDAISRDLRHRPVLTVSDIEEFADRRGIIQFVTDRGRIRLRVNLAAANAAHLQLSSKLLRAAEVVAAARD